MKLTESAQSIQEAAELIRELNHQLTEYQYMLYRIHKENLSLNIFNGNLGDEIIYIKAIEFSIRNGGFDVQYMKRLGLQSNFAKLKEKVNKLI